MRIAIKELLENELLDPARDRPDTLQFRHALVQEVAYSRILQRHARALHLQIADAIESLDGSDGETGDVLADHLYRADAGTARSNSCSSRPNGRKACSPTTPRSSTCAGPESSSCEEDPGAADVSDLTLRLADLHRQVGASAAAGELYRSLLGGTAALGARVRTRGQPPDAGQLSRGDRGIRRGPGRGTDGTRVGETRARSLPHGRRQLPRRDRVLYRRSRRRVSRRSVARRPC